MADPVLVAGQGGQYSVGPPGGIATVYGNAAGGVYIQSTQTDTGTPSTQDQAIVGQDGQQFGVDTLPGMVVTQTGFVLMPGQQAAAMDAYSALAGAWNNPAQRLVPGVIQVLRAKYPYSNVTRRCYGRGRKIMPSWGQVFQGVVPFVAQFQAADNYWYEDALSTQTLTQVPSFSGGLNWPVTPPFQWSSQTSYQQGTLANTGSVPTWPVFTFTGPISQPGVSYINTPLSLLYNGVLKQADQLVIDTRPWARTVLLNGISVAGALSGESMMNMALQPGSTVAHFTGQDYTGTATLQVSWRSATLAIGGTV